MRHLFEKVSSLTILGKDKKLVYIWLANVRLDCLSNSHDLFCSLYVIISWHLCAAKGGSSFKAWGEDAIRSFS